VQGVQRCSHGVVAAVDMQDLTGDGAGPVRQKEAGGVGDRRRVGWVPRQGRTGRPGVEQRLEPGDAARRPGVDRPGGDEVDADPGRPEVACEVGPAAGSVGHCATAPGSRGRCRGRPRPGGSCGRAGRHRSHPDPPTRADAGGAAQSGPLGAMAVTGSTPVGSHWCRTRT